jgi:phytoene dehydrogenase-like protein
MKKTIGIIGAGLGGLTAGALFTHQGHNVTIYEKESCIGGRALSFDGSSLTKEQYLHFLNAFHMAIPFAEPDLETIFSEQRLSGYTLDLGFHVIGGGVVSNLHSIFDAIKQPHINMIETRLARVTQDGYSYPFLTTFDKLRMLPKILRLITANEQTMQDLDHVSMRETINKYQNGKLTLTLEMFSRVITTVNNLEKISTGEMLRAQRNLLSGSRAVGYPRHGLQTIYTTLADFITSHGGIIHTATPVQKLHIDDHCATSVQTPDNTTNFDAVVSNVPVQRLFSFAPEQAFPKDYATMVKNLQGTGSLCAYYALPQVKKELLGKTFLFIERSVGVDGNDIVGMIDFMTALPDTGVSPPGMHLVQAYVICTPEEAKKKTVLNKLKTILDTNIEHLIPNYSSKLHWALYPTVWQLDGVAKTIDNVKPEVITPIENLFFVGDCLKAPGIGINCALNSARQLAEIL